LKKAVSSSCSGMMHYMLNPDYQIYGFVGHPRLRGGQDTKRGLSKGKDGIGQGFPEEEISC
jgi:hypothetical protein